MRSDLDKRKRHDLIRELIRSKPIGTQEELVNEIRGREFNVTQTTISRDLEEMQVGKWNGKYHIPFGESDSLAWFETIRQQVIDYKKIGDHLVLLQTKPGTSMIVEKTFNDQNMPEIAGVVASGLTVMIAFESITHQQVLMGLLQKALNKVSQ